MCISPDALQSVRDTIAATNTGVAMDMLDMRRRSFERVLAQAGHDPRHALPLLDTFVAIRFGDVVFIPGALDLLGTIPAGVKVVALTNGNSDPRRLGFGQYFDTVILGEAYPFKKTDPRLFAVMLAQLGAAPERVVHVGDSLKNDVQGANRAGVTSVWFNRQGLRAPRHIRPDHTVSTLRRVPTFLNGA